MKEGRKRKKTKMSGELKELKDGSGVMLAETYNPDAHDVRGMWMSEKLDGVRALWDGERALRSRNGSVFEAPEELLALLPRIPLDGELWTRRGDSQNLLEIVRTQLNQKAPEARRAAEERWGQVSYVVFDAPLAEGPFEKRLATAASAIQARRPQGAREFARVLEQVECTGRDHLDGFLASVEALQGEGVCLRQPASAYAAGRSQVLLKCRPFQDAEAAHTSSSSSSSSSSFSSSSSSRPERKATGNSSLQNLSFQKSLLAALGADSDEDPDYNPLDDGWDPTNHSPTRFESSDGDTDSDSNDDSSSRKSKSKSKTKTKSKSKTKTKSKSKSTPNKQPLTSQFGADDISFMIDNLSLQVAAFNTSPSPSSSSSSFNPIFQYLSSSQQQTWESSTAADLEAIVVPSSSLPLLHAAAVDGNSAAIHQLLGRGYNPCLPDANMWTARRHAVTTPSKAKRYPLVAEGLRAAMMDWALSHSLTLVHLCLTSPLDELRNLAQQWEVPRYWLGAANLIQEKCISAILQRGQ